MPTIKNDPENVKKQIHAQDAYISKLKIENAHLLSKLAKYESGQVPKSLKKKIVNDALKDKFTPAQIHQILKPPPGICQTGKRKVKPKFQR